MRLKTTYIVLCLFGLVLPYSQFIPWLAEHGLNVNLFLSELFENRISAFFAIDVLLSAVVLVVFINSENARACGLGNWLPIIALLSVGVCLALPLFLYLRERELHAREVGEQLSRRFSI
jgi:hypothetical protein